MKYLPYPTAIMAFICLLTPAGGQESGPAGSALTPLCWKPAQPAAPGKACLLAWPDGQSVVAQADDQGRLWWLGAAGGPAGEPQVRENPDATVHVKVERVGDDQIAVLIDGQPFTMFSFKKDEPRPYLYPVIGPTGDPVTRDWPMKDNPAEKERKQQDHPHHRSLWTAHGDVRTPEHADKGTDYWATDQTREIEGQRKAVYRGGNAGQQLVTKIVRTVSGPVFGLIEAEVDWVTSEGKRELSDTRTYRFFRGTDAQRVIDYQLVLHFPESDVTFADTKEGGLIATRIPPSLTEKPGEGHMVNSKGGKGGEQCWGQPADWCDYVGPVNGKTLGIAIFDAPSNFRHPTRWHIRDYGLYTANPFMARSVDKKNEDSSHTWQKGESQTFHYRLIIHKGDTAQARIAEQYATYAGTFGGPEKK